MVKTLWEIFMRTKGLCAFCGKKLVFDRFEYKGLEGAWTFVGSPDKEIPVCLECAEEVKGDAGDNG